MFDPNELAPGIRALVLELRAHGFATCDSGDGTGQMEGALPFRHVFSTCPVDLMIAETERMARIYPESRVELLWSPNETGIIALYPDQDADGTENRPRTWAGTPDFESFDHRKHYDEDNRFGGCRAGRDGDCTWTECPQERDNEPKKTGRHCPLDTSE